MATPTRPGRRDDDRGGPVRTPRAPEPLPNQYAAVLRLQRSAGNAAVQTLARQAWPWWERAAELAWSWWDRDEEEEATKKEATEKEATTETLPGVTGESIKKALAEVKVTKKEEKVTGAVKPWEIFEHAIGNNAKKKKLYAAYKTAVKAEQKAVAAVAGAKKALAAAPADLIAKKRDALTAAVPKAEKVLEAATKTKKAAQDSLRGWVKSKVKTWSSDKELAGLDKEIKAAKKAMKKKGADKAALKKTIDDAQSKRAKRVAVLEKEVEDMDMEAGDFTRNRYTITIDDMTVSLHDHVEAYATIIDKGLEGSAKRTGGGQTVDQLVDADKSISDSNKKILKLVSSFEGKFSSVNTWDQADVTWGFIQWTTGKTGEGSLIDTLIACRNYAPKAFHRRLQRFGIDVAKDGLVITLADGKVLRGKTAAQHMQVDPVLTALLSAAGEDPELKIAQLRHANDKVGKEVLRSTISVGGKKVKLGEILTSELGVGSAFNRAVHAGAGAVRKTLSAAIAKHLAKNKVDTSKPVAEWGPALEPVCLEALRAEEADRMKKMALKLSDKAGSYK